MKYSPEFAVFHAAFQLWEKQVSSANLDLKNLTKKDCLQFLHIIGAAVDEICDGLQEKHCPLTREHWNFKLHLVVFVKLFCQENLKDLSDKLYEKFLCEDDLLIIVAPLPDFPTTFYFELLKLSHWNSYFTQCLRVLIPEEGSRLMTNAIRHCQESPQTAADLRLLSSLVRIINESCFPEEVRLFCVNCKGHRSPTTAREPDFNFINICRTLSDNNHILFDLLNGVECLLISATEELEGSDSFWNGCKAFHFDDVFYELTLLGISLFGDSLRMEITLNDFLTKGALQELDKNRLSDLTQNMKEWLDKGKDFEQLNILHEKATKYSTTKLFQFNIKHLKNLGSEYLQKIISCLYHYFKVLSLFNDDKFPVDQNSFSALKFCKLCKTLVTKSDLLLKEKSPTENEENEENDFSKEKLFILEKLENHLDSFTEEIPDILFMEEVCLPEEKLAVILKDENLESWKDERFLPFFESHLRELTDSVLFRSFWERISWLANVTEEQEKSLVKKYLKVLLDSFCLLDSLLQDFLIRDFYLPVKCEANRPWWRKSDGFQRQLALSLNKLTERNFSKIPPEISQYALLDFKTVLRMSVFTAINNPCQVDVIIQLLRFMPISCQIPCDNSKTEDKNGLSLLGEVLQLVLNSDNFEKNQQNAFLEMVNQLMKPVSIGARKQFSVVKYLIHWDEVFHHYILPRLHLCLKLDDDDDDDNSQNDPVFILRLLLIVLQSEQMQQATSIRGIQLHVVLVQICYSLNNSIENWKDVNKRQTIGLKKTLLISALSLLQDILLKNLPSQHDKVLKWLSQKLSLLDWTVQLRLRKLLFLSLPNSERDFQLGNKIILSFLKTHEITQTCDLQQTLHLLRLTSIDEDLCSNVCHVLPSYILFSRDSVTIALAQLLPNFSSAELILVSHFLLHLLRNNQLIIPCQTGFLSFIPCIDLSVLRSQFSLSQLFLDVIILQAGLETEVSHFVFDNIFMAIKSVLLSPSILSEISPMLSLLLIHQIFSMMNLLLHLLDFINQDKVLLFLIELITTFNQNFSMFQPIPKKKKRALTKNEEAEISRSQSLESNLDEVITAEVHPPGFTDSTAEGVASLSPDKFHIALTLELLSSMIDQIHQLSGCEIKNSILTKLEEMKQPFQKVCKKIQ